MLTEREVTTKVEILPQTGHIQIQKAKQVVRTNDDSTEEIVASNPWRTVVEPGDKAKLVELLGQDSADLIEQGAWTTEVLAAWEARQLAST